MEINKYNTYTNSSTGTQKESTGMSQKKEDFEKIIIPKAQAYLAETAQREVPENGLFTKVYAAFEVPDSNNNGLLYIIPHPKNNKTERIFLIGVHHKNSDRLFSNEILTGTKKEIINFIKDSKNQKEITDTVYKLSKQSDSFYN